ncbi:MAG TPA: hypothetical protein VK021_09780 [Flavobacteriaceae bacterium]|nr:hypothetical protein [Flavobacteriaceae bacterium]
MTNNKIVLREIDNSFKSYQDIISLYEQYQDKMFVDLNIELLKWFSANMSAALGSVLDLLEKKS